jgi:choline-sulfatase
LRAFYEDYQVRRAQGWTRCAHDSVLPADAFEDCYIGRRAAEWIRDIPDDFPWYYFVSFVGPHDPYDPPTLYAERYRDLEMPPPVRDELEGKPRWVGARQVETTDREIAVTRQQYCAATEAIDDQIGDILDALEARGMLENTYIVFTSDHGEMLGDHGLYAKSAAYEASLRIPLIVSGPNIAPGCTSDALVELIDLNPTLCELVGLPVQENLDAQSLVPVLLGEQAAHREDVVSAIRHWRCIRTRNHKLIQSYNDETELYDLQQDPNELLNIAAQQPDLVRELGARLGARFKEGQWLR